jgi:hypothetical protein
MFGRNSRNYSCIIYETARPMGERTLKRDDGKDDGDAHACGSPQVHGRYDFFQ